MKIKHLSLSGLTPYLRASSIQERVVRRFLDYKALPAATVTASASSLRPPAPIIITAQFHPVYTCGRREVARLAPEQIEHLRRGGQAEFHEALRGGQTTYHGPGQLTAYPILDLKTCGLPPRDYICKLEGAVIKTCANFGVDAFRTEHPGVWTSGDEKVCAVGVHLRRYITSHGIGLNVRSETADWFDRIVACGLQGKRATSLEACGVDVADLTVEDVGRVFTNELAHGLGFDGVESVQEEEL